MRTITVEGDGKSSRRPDLVVLEIKLSTIKEEFGEAMNSMTCLVNELKDSLKDIGFEERDLKTSYFNISQEYNSVEKGLINKEYSRKFNGFKVNQNMKLEFDFNNERLSEVINCLNNYDDHLRFELEFSVKDKESMKMEVLEKATENARFTAEVLAKSSSVELGDLVKINCDTARYSFRSSVRINRLDLDYNLDCCTISEIEPEEIEIDDTVEFVWEIV